MNRIRQKRIEQGLTLKKLSELTNIHYVNLGRYEKGQRGLEIEKAAVIAAALNCTVDDLIEKETA